MKKCMLSLLILSLCGVFFIDAAVAYDPFYLQAAAQGSAAVKQLANDQNVSVVKTEGVKKAKPVNTNAGCVLLENMPTNPEDDSFIQDFINWLDDTTYSGSDEYLYLNGEASRAEKSLFICGAKAGKTWCGKTDIIYIDGNSGAFIGSAPQDKRGFYRCSTSDLDDLWTVWKSLAGLKKCDYNQIKEYHCVGDPTDNEKKVCFSVEPTVRSNLIYAVLKESQMCTTSVELYEHVLSEESDAKNVSAGDKKDSNAEFEESGAKNVSAGNKKDIKTEEMVISGGDIDIDDVVADVKEYCFDILDAGVKNPDCQEFITASCDSGDAKKTKECKQLVEKSLSSGPTSKEGVSDDKGSIKDKKGAAKKDGKTDSKKQSGTTGGTKSSGTADEGCDFYSSALVKCNGEDILLDKEKIYIDAKEMKSIDSLKTCKQFNNRYVKDSKVAQKLVDSHNLCPNLIADKQNKEKAEKQKAEEEAKKAEAKRQRDAKEKEINGARDRLQSVFDKIDSDKSVWKNADGSFNTIRLASDLTAGVVLGTVGGVVSGVLIKKSQVEKGFDALHCTVGGQKVADWGDEFSVGLRR